MVDYCPKLMDLKVYIQLVLLCALNVVFTCTGVFFNLLVIVSFWRSSAYLRSKLYYFMIMVLSFFDFLLVITNYPLLVIRMVLWLKEKNDVVKVQIYANFCQRVYWLFYDDSTGNEHRKISWCVLSILSSNIADQTQITNTPCTVIPCTTCLSDDFCERLGHFLCKGCDNFLHNYNPSVRALQLQTVHHFKKSSPRHSNTSRQHIISRDIDVAC